MSISGALNNALTGLTAGARMAQVVSSNLSNALTEGYGRRTISLSSAEVGGSGAGVRVDGVLRFVDQGLLADRRLADAALAGHDRTADLLARLETSLGTPDDPANLAARLAAVEGALIRASADPASEQRLDAVVSRLDDLVTTFKRNNAAIQSLRQEADRAIADDIQRLNENLQRVEVLNTDIMRLKSSGDDTSALVDNRQRLVDEIAGSVPLRVTTREDGTIRLMTTSGLPLVDGRAVSFNFTPTPTITGDMTFASGALSGVFLDGQPLDATDGVGRLDGGAIGAAFALRDRTLPEVQAALDTLAADLVARFEDPANDPTIAPGAAGVLTDEGGTLDLADLPGLAGRLTLNPAIAPDGGNDSARLRDGLGAIAAGPTGDATQINRWIGALSQMRADVTGSSLQSASGRAGGFLAQTGATRLLAEQEAGFANARWAVLKEAELADGVDTDAELQTLLRVEQFYAANAKVIETADFMIRRLLEV
jgi:flagellar hook-associated protein 1 FlgK